jgi:hypothetical protein
MAAVFDGDPEPLFDIILDPDADEYVRSRMCETLAMLVVAGELPRELVAAFLTDLFDKLPRDEECWAWSGWWKASAALGLSELTPLVREAFDQELIASFWARFEDFEDCLAHAIAHPEQPFTSGSSEMTLWGDTVGELSQWYGFSEQRKKDEERRRREAAERATARSATPRQNPYKGVGRNDPCPCGSGKKYKKCCLR